MVETAATEKRILAFIMDRVIEAVFYFPIWLELGGSYLKGEALSISLRVLIACALLHLLYDWFFLYFLGGTLGKLCFGLKVVPRHVPDKDLGLLQSLLRPLTDRLSLFFGYSLRALAFLRFDRTHVSDWVAETWVVQFVPRRRRPVRRPLFVLIIIMGSLGPSFFRTYDVVQSARLEKDRIVFTEVAED